MRKSVLVLAMILGTVLVLPAAAQTDSVVVSRSPGAVGVSRTVEVTARITAIDAAAREITLRGPQGNELTVVAGPEVRNFDQLGVGDTVGVQYVEALALELKKGGGKPVARTERAGVVSARPGETPGGIAGRRITIVGDVVAVDAPNRTVTVRGPQRTVDLEVKDPEQLKLVSKGDQVELTYTEAAAISVTPVNRP